jgi:hypothetical protein
MTCLFYKGFHHLISTWGLLKKKKNKGFILKIMNKYLILNRHHFCKNASDSHATNTRRKMGKNRWKNYQSKDPM